MFTSATGEEVRSRKCNNKKNFVKANLAGYVNREKCVNIVL